MKNIQKNPTKSPILRFLVIFLLTISQAHSIEITPITKDSPAPDDGFFVDPQNMKEFRKINEDKKLLERENLKLKDLSIIKEERIEIYKGHINDTEKQLKKEQFKSTTKGAIGFIIGIATASLATYFTLKYTDRR